MSTNKSGEAKARKWGGGITFGRASVRAAIEDAVASGKFGEEEIAEAYGVDVEYVVEVRGEMLGGSEERITSSEAPEVDDGGACDDDDVEYEAA